jgi:hypothetical protein
MKNVRVLTAVSLCVALAVLAGHGSSRGTVPQGGKDKKEPEKGHSHGIGPHGGVVFDLGKFHAEFTVDHKKKEATVYILGGDAKTPAAVKAKDDLLLLRIKQPAFEVVLKAAPLKGDADGKASRFVGAHDKLGKEQEFEGIVAGEVDGKLSVGQFKEEVSKK